MHQDQFPSDPELTLALLQRNGLARSLLRHPRRTGALDLVRALRTLSQLGTTVARRRPAGDSHQLPQFLLDAARRVRESAAVGEPLPWQTTDP